MKKLRKRLIRISLGLALLHLVVVITGHSYIYTTLANTVLKGRLGPTIEEFKNFPARSIAMGEPQPWPNGNDYNQQAIPAEHQPAFDALDPVAFLVIQNDSVRMEHYWDGYDAHSMSNSFSMAKSVISILIGIAIDEGKINSVDQPVGDFLMEYNIGANRAVTIRHLLTMSSGINFDENYINPFAFPARANYGDNLEMLVYKYEATQTPGQTFEYQSGNTQLLSFLLQKATGMSVSDYASRKLWKPLGADNAASWSLDRTDGFEKAFCCINSNARDFARLGQLYLHQGTWKGQPMVSADYVAASITPANLLEKDGTPNKRYGYSWWLENYKGRDIFYARGILGQYIIVSPKDSLTIVRLGHKRNKKRADLHPRDLYLYLDIALELYGL